MQNIGTVRIQYPPCKTMLDDQQWISCAHARRKKSPENSNGAAAVSEPDDRGGEAKELQSGGAIMNKLAASNELYPG